MRYTHTLSHTHIHTHTQSLFRLQASIHLLPCKLARQADAHAPMLTASALTCSSIAADSTADSTLASTLSTSSVDATFASASHAAVVPSLPSGDAGFIQLTTDGLLPKAFVGESSCSISGAGSADAGCELRRADKGPEHRTLLPRCRPGVDETVINRHKNNQRRRNISSIHISYGVSFHMFIP